MSAVEQARAATFWCLDCERACSRCASCESALNALIAAVRAERDAAWREGVEAMRMREPDVGEGSSVPRGVRRAHNGALAALAARMEAK